MARRVRDRKMNVTQTTALSKQNVLKSIYKCLKPAAIKQPSSNTEDHSGCRHFKLGAEATIFTGELKKKKKKSTRHDWSDESPIVLVHSEQ